MAGVNQSIMLSLSMVVIASMVGAPGLGEEVYRAVTQLKTGVGVEVGVAIVIVAIILDRITQHAGTKKQGGNTFMTIKKKVLGLRRSCTTSSRTCCMWQ